MSKYFQVLSEWEILAKTYKSELFIKADDIKKVHRYLENYCCSVGEDSE